jgi:rfaE bifunctional protein kinase chain/domain
VIGRLRGRRVLVIADLVADEFVVCRPQRVSREAPVLILEHDSAEVRLGGGANAAANLRALGGRPLPVGVLGADDHGRHVRRLLKEAGIPATRVFNEAGYVTPVKSRVLAGGTHASKQQVLRIDRVLPLAATAAVRSRVKDALREVSGRLDGILVSDYGLGLVTPGLVRAALGLARRRRIPITVDSRHALLSFRGMTAVTPNEPEVEEALGISIGHDVARLETAGRTLLERLQSKAVLITRGGDGMSLFEAGRPPLHISPYGSDEVTDVTGAGDTVIATFTLALAAGAAPGEAARLANYAGGLVVMKRGTATVSAAELEEAVASESR